MTALSILIPVGGATSTDQWRSRSLMWLKQRYAALLPDAELVFGTSDAEPFSRSAARNDAFVRSSGDVLLIADADVVFNMDQIDAGLALIDAGAPWVVAYREDAYFNLTPQATLTVLASDPGAYVPEPTDPGDWELRLTSWAGLLLVPLAAWACTGGYPTALDGGWGYDDTCMRHALDMLAGPHERTDGFVAHLYHPRGEEFTAPHIPRHRAIYEEYERATTPEAMMELCAKYGPEQ